HASVSQLFYAGGFNGLRSTIIAAGSLLVLFMLLFWIPLDMPLKFTLSWMKGAQTIEATSVKQLADAGVRVGDTLRISGTVKKVNWFSRSRFRKCEYYTFP
ncbi:IgaA/UmoB family intracellular growth attenuator, partial [Escherichia sp. TWPC-MK]